MKMLWVYPLSALHRHIWKENIFYIPLNYLCCKFYIFVHYDIIKRHAVKKMCDVHYSRDTPTTLILSHLTVLNFKCDNFLYRHHNYRHDITQIIPVIIYNKINYHFQQINHIVKEVQAEVGTIVNCARS